MNMLFTFNAVYHKQGLRIFISQSDGIQIRLVFALVRSPSHPRNESNIFMIFFQCATRWIVMLVQSEAKQGYKSTEKQESVLNSSKFILFMGNWGFAFTAESSEWLLAACLLVDTRRLFCLVFVCFPPIAVHNTVECMDTNCMHKFFNKHARWYIFVQWFFDSSE